MLFETPAGMCESDKERHGTLLLAVFYSYSGELASARVLHFKFSNGRIANGSYPIKRFWDIGVEMVYDLYSLRDLTSDGTTFTFNAPVSAYDYKGTLLTPLYYQLASECLFTHNSACLGNVLLVHPDGSYIQTSAKNVQQKMNELQAKSNIPISLENQGVSVMSYTLPIFNKAVSPIADKITETSVDLASVPGVVTMRGNRAFITNLPKAPFAIFPPNIPNVKIDTNETSQCSQIKFPVRVDSDIDLALTHPVSKLILPKESTRGITLVVFNNLDIANITFPERCEYFKLGYFNTKCNDTLLIPKIEATKIALILYFNAKSLECYATGDLKLQFKQLPTNLNQVPDTQTVHTNKYRIHSTKAVDIALCTEKALNAFGFTCLGSAETNAFYLDVDYVNTLYLYLPYRLTDLYLSYSKINKVRILIHNTVHVHFICKSGGTPIKRDAISRIQGSPIDYSSAAHAKIIKTFTKE